ACGERESRRVRGSPRLAESQTIWSPAFPGADPGGLSQRALPPINDRVSDEFAIELDRGDAFRFGLREGRDDPLGEGDLVLARREYAAAHSHLVRVDAHLALEAVAEGGASRGFEALGILQIDPHRIERRFETGGARSGDDPGAGIGQFGLVALPLHVDVEREITGAEGNALDPRAGSKDRVEVG